jgi:FkbM family methyltransferase
LAAAAVRWNAHANLGDKSVTIRELALSDHSGELEFAVVSPLAGDNGALADSPYERHHIKVLRVRCGRLDDELRLEGRNILLKVDVEGHELSVLEGATTVLSANRGFMQIEMHESPSLGQKIEFLNDLGWHQISRVGPDHYFSNISSTYSDAFRAEMLEGAMGILVDSSKCARRASRRRIATGVYLEVSRKKVDAVKRLLRR